MQDEYRKLGLINEYNSKGIYYPQEKNDWIKSEKNN